MSVAGASAGPREKSVLVTAGISEFPPGVGVGSLETVAHVTAGVEVLITTGAVATGCVGTLFFEAHALKINKLAERNNAK